MSEPLFASLKPKGINLTYVESGEGIDRAGGFAIQGLGGMLIRKVEGDYHNVVGFPTASFSKLLELLVDLFGSLSCWSTV